MNLTQLKSGNLDLFRRDFIKDDGRTLRLYGYGPHDHKSLPQTPSEVAAGGELRWHPLRQEWNIYAPHRQNRTFKPSIADDPLAPTLPGGVETEIPFENFELAIFENKFTSLHRDAPHPSSNKILEKSQALGHCDVVVYGPEASGNIYTIGQSKRRLLAAAWIDRYQALLSDGHKFVIPFENRGDEVGVTLHHPHGQIYAFSIIPTVQMKAATAFEKGFNIRDILSGDGSAFIVNKIGDMVAFCPPFARFPFEVWIAPLNHHPGPWSFSDTELEDYCFLLGDVTRRYDKFFERDTASMMSLHASPLGYERSFHFTTQFYPILRDKNRVKYLASIEQSTGVFTVDVMPEFAAQQLRDIGDRV